MYKSTIRTFVLRCFIYEHLMQHQVLFYHQCLIQTSDRHFFKNKSNSLESKNVQFSYVPHWNLPNLYKQGTLDVMATWQNLRLLERNRAETIWANDYLNVFFSAELWSKSLVSRVFQYIYFVDMIPFRVKYNKERHALVWDYQVAATWPRCRQRNAKLEV